MSLKPALWPPRDTVDIDYYSIDFSKWLKTETISNADWSLVNDVGLAIDHDEKTGTVATVWLTGGVGDAIGEVSCTVMSSGGRVKREIGRVRVGINPAGT